VVGVAVTGGGQSAELPEELLLVEEPLLEELELLLDDAWPPEDELLDEELLDEELLEEELLEEVLLEEVLLPEDELLDEPLELELLLELLASPPLEELLVGGSAGVLLSLQAASNSSVHAASDPWSSVRTKAAEEARAALIK
jgi:hypothetical protein